MGNEITDLKKQIKQLDSENSKLKNKIVSLALDLKECKVDRKIQKLDFKTKISKLENELQELKRPRHEDFIKMIIEEEKLKKKNTKATS